MTPETKLLAAAELRVLSRVTGWRAPLQIAIEWGWIALILAAATHWTHPALIPLWILLVGARMHALAVLMHDSAHGRLLPDRRLNYVAAELLLALPVMINLPIYRRNHLAHHRYLQTPLDPDWALWPRYRDYWFPKKSGAVVWDMICYGIGLRIVHMIEIFRIYAHQDARPEGAKEPAERTDGLERTMKLVRPVFYAIALAAVIRFHAWKPFLLFWLVPLLTTFPMALHIRAVAEHFVSENGGPESLPTTRSLRLNLLERILIAPNHVGYHLEHHLYPSVPFHRLPELHRRLMSNPEFRTRARITPGLLGVIRECGTSRSVLELWERQTRPASAPNPGH
jgi:fatty acid desaturase